MIKFDIRKAFKKRPFDAKRLKYLEYIRKDAERFFPLTQQQKRNIEYIDNRPQERNINKYLFCMYKASFKDSPLKTTRPTEEQTAFMHFVASIYPKLRTGSPKGILKFYLVKKKENGIPKDYPTIFINPSNYKYYASIIYAAIDNLTL